MNKEDFPPACRFEEGDEPGAILFALYNRGGPEGSRGIAWDGREVPGFADTNDQVREKWRDFASAIGYEGIQADHLPVAAPCPLPELHHGHAWLLKFLFSNFRTDAFTFDLDTGNLEGGGKGIKIENELENARTWFRDCVDHGAVGLHESTTGAGSPVWFVRSLANTTESVTSLDPNRTLDALVSDFVSVLELDVIKNASAVVVKGAGIPEGFGDKLYVEFVKRGAPDNVLVVALPPGIDLSVIDESKMRAKGWQRVEKKPRLWKPGDPLTLRDAEEINKRK